MSITTTHDAVIISFDTAITLYRLGRFDPALLAYCIPKDKLERECPEVLGKLLQDPEDIAFVSELVGPIKDPRKR